METDGAILQAYRFFMIHHGVSLTIFDTHFVAIVTVAPLELNCLARAA